MEEFSFQCRSENRHKQLLSLIGELSLNSNFEVFLISPSDDISCLKSAAVYYRNSKDSVGLWLLDRESIDILDQFSVLLIETARMLALACKLLDENQNTCILPCVFVNLKCLINNFQCKLMQLPDEPMCVESDLFLIRQQFSFNNSDLHNPIVIPVDVDDILDPFPICLRPILNMYSVSCQISDVIGLIEDCRFNYYELSCTLIVYLWQCSMANIIALKYAKRIFDYPAICLNMEHSLSVLTHLAEDTSHYCQENMRYLEEMFFSHYQA